MDTEAIRFGRKIQQSTPSALPSDLSTETVHLWTIHLDQAPDRVHGLAETLSADELRRAERFSFDRDRRRFIVARAALREILAGYLGLEPNQIAFCYGTNGKPALAGTAGGSKLYFNVAHSGELALCAVNRCREVGVDLELIRPVPDADRISLEFFSSPEREALDSLPPDERLEAFFRCWTRKEAYLKALGDGLARSLQAFQVSVDDRPDILLTVEGDPAEVSRWRLHHLEPAPHYIGALAVAGEDWVLVKRQWPGARDNAYRAVSRK